MRRAARVLFCWRRRQGRGEGRGSSQSRTVYNRRSSPPGKPVWPCAAQRREAATHAGSSRSASVRAARFRGVWRSERNTQRQRSGTAWWEEPEGMRRQGRARRKGIRRRCRRRVPRRGSFSDRETIVSFRQAGAIVTVPDCRRRSNRRRHLLSRRIKFVGTVAAGYRRPYTISSSCNRIRERPEATPNIIFSRRRCSREN